MYSATYSPDDNKLRLYASSRLDAETYARVKAAGFKWAPKQDLFVAPMWTPEREDLLIELAGSVDDEDTSLVDRAEERAERFEGYEASRMRDAESARKGVAAIADNIPFGQPILVGHHSEKHARRDQARIECGMRRAVDMWKTSKYWAERAAGAVAHAQYKELPPVRARRIKTIEADKRKLEKQIASVANSLKFWRDVQGTNDPDLQMKRAVALANYDHISRRFPLADFPRNPPASQYEGDIGLWSALTGGIIDGRKAADIAISAYSGGEERRARWLQHYENRLTYERAMLTAAGGTVADQTGPEKGGAVRCWASPGYGKGWSYIQKVNKVSVSVLDDYGNGGRAFSRTIPFDKLLGVMTAAQVQDARDTGQLVNSHAGIEVGFFLRGAAPIERATKEPEPKAAEFEAIDAALKEGVKVVVAPQLFPTPAELAARMVALASLATGDAVLEPSAGTGALVEAIQAAGIPVSIRAIEINTTLAQNLNRTANKDLDVSAADFLEWENDVPDGFDVVLMNPPFANAVDIKHILRARSMLKPHGRLVALCANGPRQREALQSIAEHWEDLPAGTFKEQGTGVNVALVVLGAE
jgi:phospholipid N-methyltransferase